MKTISRTQFLIYANLVWGGQFVAEILSRHTPGAIAWQQRISENMQVGCVGDTAAYNPGDRLFLFALMWMISAPLMTVIALRMPAAWPERMEPLLWKGRAPGLSMFTLVGALALLAWPVAAAIATPVTSVILVEAARGLALLAVALYYRGVILSR